MLYHWTSPEYLEGLVTLIDALMNGVDTTLALASRQHRDQLLTSTQWGVRDTARNWASAAQPALQEFKEDIIWHIAQRSQNHLGRTGLTQCDRLLNEISPYWMTPEEKKWFETQWQAIHEYAYRHDQAVGSGGQRLLADNDMPEHWAKVAAQFPRIPRFKVHTDREYWEAELPDKTGVYVPVDDPDGVLQFAWSGAEQGALSSCQTLSEVGKLIVARVGRDRMWLDHQAMVNVIAPMYACGDLTDRSEGFDVGDELDPRWISGTIFDLCITERSCKWFYVEKLEGEFEDAPALQADGSGMPGQGRLRCEARQPCPRTGLWFSPAADGPRQFKQGDLMPEMPSDYGLTIWYLAQAQN